MPASTSVVLVSYSKQGNPGPNFKSHKKLWGWGCLVPPWRCSVTTDTEYPFKWETVWIWVVKGKMCWQKPDVACSVSSFDEDEKGQGPQPSAFHLSLCSRLWETQEVLCVALMLHKSQAHICSGVPFERETAKATV